MGAESTAHSAALKVLQITRERTATARFPRALILKVRQIVHYANRSCLAFEHDGGSPSAKNRLLNIDPTLPFLYKKIWAAKLDNLSCP